ncbi:organic cation transporter protein isoform X3 [Anabrus simplex]|uniref:organic cation transporter protein isoform X3 n=1 Tax=Anabrus simplex TaxID=316456 RepID=UPI0035A33FFA
MPLTTTSPSPCSTCHIHGRLDRSRGRPAGDLMLTSRRITLRETFLLALASSATAGCTIQLSTRAAPSRSGTWCATMPGSERQEIPCLCLEMFWDLLLLAFSPTALEMVGPSKRVLAGVACQLFFTTGYILTAGFAYFITDWRMLQVALTVPAIGFLSYWWFLPESTRWLLANGRPEEAKVFLLKAAKENKVIIPPDVLDGLVPEGEKEKVPLEPERKPSFFDLIRYPNLRKRALNIFLNWFVNNSTYYGLSWNTSNLGGNDYLNFVISGAVEVPAYTFLILTLNRWGRKSILCGCMLLGGAALLLTLAVPIELNWLTITLAMIGKLAVTASYGTIYVFTAEQFPTVIRNVALGASSTCARAGGITAPYINLLADTWRSLPLLIFGVMITTGGLLALQLPETLNKKLPDTIQEGEKFGCKPKFEEEQHGRELEIVHKLGSKGSMA